MIAVSVISIALVAVLGSQTQGLSLANESRFNTTATFLAQGKMAEIESTKEPGKLTSDSGDFGEDFPNYFWEQSVNDVSFQGADQISSRLKRIDLTVFWGSERRYPYHLRLYRFLPKGN